MARLTGRPGPVTTGYRRARLRALAWAWRTGFSFRPCSAASPHLPPTGRSIIPYGSTWGASFSLRRAVRVGTLTAPLRAVPPLSNDPRLRERRPTLAQPQTSRGGGSVGSIGFAGFGWPARQRRGRSRQGRQRSGVCQGRQSSHYNNTGRKIAQDRQSRELSSLQTGDYQITFTSGKRAGLGRSVIAKWTEHRSSPQTPIERSRSPARLRLVRRDGGAVAGAGSRRNSRKTPRGRRPSGHIYSGMAPTSLHAETGRGPSTQGISGEASGYSQMVSWLFEPSSPPRFPWGDASANVAFTTTGPIGASRGPAGRSPLRRMV